MLSTPTLYYWIRIELKDKWKEVEDVWTSISNATIPMVQSILIESNNRFNDTNSTRLYAGYRSKELDYVLP